MYLFFLEGRGCHLFVFAMDGHPSIVLFGRGSLLLFYLEGLATYLFFIFCFFGGVATYLFSIWGWPSSLLGRGAGH